MPGKFDAYIIQEGNEFRVRPAVSMIEAAGKKFKVRNLTQYGAFLAFPANFLAGNQGFAFVPGNSKVQANLVAGLNGHYHYAVVVNKNGEIVQAQGESAPSVIVDP